MLNRIMRDMGLKSQITKLPKRMRPSANDYIELERSIAIDINENEDMLAKSEILASRCPLM